MGLTYKITISTCAISQHISHYDMPLLKKLLPGVHEALLHTGLLELTQEEASELTGELRAVNPTALAEVLRGPNEMLEGYHPDIAHSFVAGMVRSLIIFLRPVN
jgi:hypothetical protein